MTNIKLSFENTLNFISKDEINAYSSKAIENIKMLKNKTGKGSDFTGWVNLPSSISEDHFKDIEDTAARLKDKIDVAIVIGIGGSYLGAKAVNDAISHNFETLKNKHDNPLLLFAGQNICEDYIYELRETLEDKSYAIIVISKSGTTTEPALAFR